MVHTWAPYLETIVVSGSYSKRNRVKRLGNSFSTSRQLVGASRRLTTLSSKNKGSIRSAATSFTLHDQLYAQNRSKSERSNPDFGSLICWICSLRSARSSVKLVAADRIVGVRVMGVRVVGMRVVGVRVVGIYVK